MTKDQLAKTLNGRSIGSELTRAESKQAAIDRLVVIFGASDDLIELNGAINDEINAYNGGECFIESGTLLPSLDDEDEMDILGKYGVLDTVQAAHQKATRIEGKWSEGEYSWFITTEAPFAPFDIMEGDEKYCRGIVIDLRELEGK